VFDLLTIYYTCCYTILVKFTVKICWVQKIIIINAVAHKGYVFCSLCKVLSFQKIKFKIFGLITFFGGKKSFKFILEKLIVLPQIFKNIGWGILTLLFNDKSHQFLTQYFIN
jgi:hypothetical protein